MRRGIANRGRAQPRVNRSDPIERRLRQFERRLTGHKTVPATNPPAFVQLPWNSWTFERTDNTTAALQGFNITVSDILGQIRSRINIDQNADLRVKIQSSQVWCTASGLVLPDLEATFYDIAGETTATTQQPRSVQRDIGTLNMPARCGYNYPSVDKKEIVDSTQGNLIVTNGIATAQGSNITFRVQVLWQCSA